jgi:uncharacterized protein YjiS (DUF1127 family)
MFQFRDFIDAAIPVDSADARQRSLPLRLVTWPLRVLAARRAMAQLGVMSDRELADVGLCRQDLRDASALSFGEDPTAMFAARTAERRRARRAAILQRDE